MARPVTAYVALGANLGDPAAQLRSALKALIRLPQTQVLAASSFYRTAPVGVDAQPDYLNAVAALATRLPPPELLQALLDIEAGHGRRRTSGRGEARPLDLDLLLYGSEQLRTPTLTLPHPRMHQRAFVLAPLAEIAADLEVPGQGSVATLLANCIGQRVERL